MYGSSTRSGLAWGHVPGAASLSVRDPHRAGGADRPARGADAAQPGRGRAGARAAVRPAQVRQDLAAAGSRLRAGRRRLAHRAHRHVRRHLARRAVRADRRGVLPPGGRPAAGPPRLAGQQAGPVPDTGRARDLARAASAHPQPGGHPDRRRRAARPPAASARARRATHPGRARRVPGHLERRTVARRAAALARAVPRRRGGLRLRRLDRSTGRPSRSSSGRCRSTR
jgi:hypothetical protein